MILGGATVCRAQYDVYNRAELIAAINNTSIPWVRIPTGVEITIINELQIGAGHPDDYRFTIDGTLKWDDTPSALQPNQETMININGASHCLIDGSGTLTSSFLSCAINCTPPYYQWIAKGIRIASAFDIVVENLDFNNISSMVIAEGIDTTTDVTLRNLTGTALAEYGAWLGNSPNAKIQGLTVEDCHVDGTSNFHGFRMYADNIVMRNCSALNTARRGFWVVRGDGVYVDGFHSNKWCWVGPDTENPNTASTERVTNSEFHHLDVPEFRLDGGVECCYFTDVCTTVSPGVRIGRDSYTVVLPISDIHWSDIVGSPAIGTHSSINTSTIYAVAACTGDVDRSGPTNINDLLEVINNWGGCPGGTSVCRPDADPPPCGNGAVDINDLLVVINGWGPCPQTPLCGGNRLGGQAAPPPESLEDCWNEATALYEQGSARWYESYNACVQSLCEQQLIDCD